MHVSAKAIRSGDGSERHPFLKIGEAAAIAAPGDTVLVAPGVYRECVVPAQSGRADARVTYRSVVPGGAVITGAERVTGWIPYRGNIWRIVLPEAFFGGYNPYSTMIYGDWLDRSVLLHTGQIYLDGQPLREVGTLEECEHPAEEETRLPWYTRQENGGTVLFADFGGADPNVEEAELLVRRNCFMPQENGIDYITVSGFVLQQAATQWAPPTAYQDGLIGPHWSKGWIIEDCEIAESRCAGISLGKYLQPQNENRSIRTGIKDGTQTERDAVCQAVNEGWDRAHVGSHTVRRCHIHDCGQAGIVGHLGAIFSTIEDNEIERINNPQELKGAEIAGIKLHAAIDVVLRRNHIHHCTRGLWLDWQAQGTRVTQNLFHDNEPEEGKPVQGGLCFGEDLFIEVSHGPTLVDHNIFLSTNACRLSTQGIAFVHNLICGGFTYVGEGTDNGAGRFPSPRYTPYHVPHDTRIAGFMTILHGDARFYNNIFVQRPVRPELSSFLHQRGSDTLTRNNLICGTLVYDGYPTVRQYFDGLDQAMRDRVTGKERFYDHLPVETGGNAFFGGAVPCSAETAYFRDEEFEVYVQLMEAEEGQLVLHTNLYERLPRELTQPVDSGLLGCAFESEQRFEERDGADLIFDRDYVGMGRGPHPLAGPFEDPEEAHLVWMTAQEEEPPVSFIDSVRDVRERAVQAIREAQETLQQTEESKEHAERAEREIRIRLGRDDIPEPDPLFVRKLQSDIALTNCGEISFPFEGALFQIQDIFVRGDVCWLRDMQGRRLIELDCAYGIYRSHDHWEMHTMEALDIQMDANMEGMVQTIGTLLCILSRSMAHDAEETCRSISERVNEGLELRGITMRLTPKYLKFIRDKKFISLEDVIYRINRAPMTIVSEVLTSENLGED
ncbi:MAG: right-handed parallel beta-helix repeat-containing protein [Butyrivibrio sp.]|nr:right-handed parallel beta-helix repeat-containing protein [Butyrivibrio sp.]